MIIWGISANSHDAAISVWYDKELKFAAHSERYSRIKNDPDLCPELVVDALAFGYPKLVVWYENPHLKTARQLIAGQGLKWSENNIKQYLASYGIIAPITFTSHHKSHAAGGYYTSKFADATVICIDAIGEFETMSIWEGKGSKLTKRFSQSYPHSIGLWYSSMTQRCGLKPNEDEYILMGMAAYGDKYRFQVDLYSDFLKSTHYPEVRFHKNLHRGCKDWRPELTTEQDMFDLAASTQFVYTQVLEGISNYARHHYSSGNLVLMGGCALNCLANSSITKDWNNVWIMPNPGDAGSSVGAVAGWLGEHVNWPGPYLGHNIKGPYPVDRVLCEILNNDIVGVASGRAEFGPRALGNRSLLANPMGPLIKDKVNDIKQRQKYRPFAPAILAEHAHEYFEMPYHTNESPFMQFVSKCKYPEKYPAIVHMDGTSRVQTVSKNDNSGFRQLLEDWYAHSGCPMLLNTSLNIRGQPIVNSREDADAFENMYKISVCS